MKQVIDMGGFKNETIEVHFGEDVYNVQLDPPIEFYRQVLEMQGTKLETEEDCNKLKNLVTNIICISNPNVNKDKLFNSLTKISALKFFNSYASFMFKASGSKNSPSPPSESKEEKK